MTTQPSGSCGAGADSAVTAVTASCPPSSPEAESLVSAPFGLPTFTFFQCVGLVLLLVLAGLAYFWRSRDLSPETSSTRDAQNKESTRHGKGIEKGDKNEDDSREGEPVSTADSETNGMVKLEEKGRDGLGVADEAPPASSLRPPVKIPSVFLTPPIQRRHVWRLSHSGPPTRSHSTEGRYVRTNPGR